jgi:hypothetical protein
VGRGYRSAGRGRPDDTGGSGRFAQESKSSTRAAATTHSTAAIAGPKIVAKPAISSMGRTASQQYGSNRPKYRRRPPTITTHSAPLLQYATLFTALIVGVLTR